MTTPPPRSELAYPAQPPADAPGVDAPAADDALSEASVDTERELPAPRRGGMLRSSAIFSGLTLVSRFMGFLRDR